MEDTGRLQRLKQSLEQMTTAQQALENLVGQLAAVLEKQDFVTQELYESMQNGMTRLVDLQEGFRALYANLLQEPLPQENLVLLKERVEKAELQISEKCIYMDAAAFFVGLRAKTQEMEQLLTAQQKKLAALTPESMTLEECRVQLEKFVSVKRWFETREIKIFLEIARAFGDELAAGMYEGMIEAPEEQPAKEAPDEEPLVKPEETDPVSQPDAAAAQVHAEPGKTETPLQAEPMEEEIPSEQRDARFYSLPDEMLQVDAPHNPKKFGAKEFIHEMKRSGEAHIRRKILSLVYQNAAVTSRQLEAFGVGDSMQCIQVLEELKQAGYLEKFTVRGYPSFYGASERGKRVFETQTTAEYLGIRPAKGKKDVRIPNTADAALVRVLCARALEQAAAFSGNIGLERSPTFPESDNFQLRIRLKQTEKFVSFLGIIAHDEQAFARLAEQLEKFDLTGCGAVVVVEPDAVCATAVADWLRRIFGEKLVPAQLYLYDYSTGLYERYSDGYKTEKPDFAAEEPAADASREEKEPQQETEEAEETPVEPEKVAAETAKTALPTMETPEKEPAPVPVQEESAAQFLPGKDPKRAEHEAIYTRMLQEGKVYCAAAYLKALSDRYADEKIAYEQLAYAVNDPLAKCSYSSENLVSVYYTAEGSLNEPFLVAAALRNYFYDQYGSDYGLQRLQDSVNATDLMTRSPHLNALSYKLQKFKSQYRCGMDCFADYRQKARERFEIRLAELQQEAREIYDNEVNGKISETVKQRRFIEVKKLLFAKEGDFGECLQLVMEDNRSMREYIEMFLQKNYIKDNAPVTSENIDTSKVEKVIEENWDKAGSRLMMQKKSSDLMGRLHSNLYKKIMRTVTVLCEYVSLLQNNSVDETNHAYIAYRRQRDDVLASISGAMQEVRREDSVGRNVLQLALEEIEKRVKGTYQEGEGRYFYIDFLRSNVVLLDRDYLPILDSVPEIEELDILERLVRHETAPEKSFEQRLQEIFNGEDDYGSAALILHYLQDMTGREYPEYEQMDLSYAEKDSGMRFKSFTEDLELAQSYGQIDNTVENREEAYRQIAEYWLENAQESKNFGFFYQILEAIRRKIRKEASGREAELRKTLDTYLQDNKDQMESEEIREAIEKVKSRISMQNFAAAEDLLNRIQENDLHSGANFYLTDDLQAFMDEYADHYKKTSDTGKSLRDLLPQHIYNKDQKGASRLVESWPKGGGSGTSAQTIQQLLQALGFRVEKVQLQPVDTDKRRFTVTLKKPSNGRKSNYTHPISAFGSEAEEDGFRVVCLFGRFDASRLLDTFQELGNTKHTLIVLDYALTLAERRALARRVKTSGTSKTFAVIDRVVLAYLARHYSETAVNRMLMAVIMPFASYQPYISDSAKVMPPEIFMGRKKELQQIESASGVNIVYGGRQLGKSALLRMAQKDINLNENGDRAVLVDIKNRDYRQVARRISETMVDEGILARDQVTEDWDALARNIKNRLRSTEHRIPYLLLLMDEADAFIESCVDVSYKPFDALKDIQSIGSGRFKFVVAGLRNVVRFNREKALGNNSVLTHLSSLTVTPFHATEARELLEVPLFYLGYRFGEDNATETLVSTIFGTTNYFPGLLQLYCSKLIEAVQKDYAGYNESETPPYIVSEAHIKKALADKTLADQIRDKFFITLKVDQDDYYYLIALLGAYHYHNCKEQPGFDAKDLHAYAVDYGISKISDLNQEQISALMEEMRELNVLQSLSNGKYRFTRHSFCQMMGNIQEIEDHILDYAVQEEE